jgi:MoaA/NifB/PqqE/SkfB family radical SAM enzyme
MSLNKKTFCIVPFTMLYSLNNGDYRACCHSEPGIPQDEDPNKAISFMDTSLEEVWNGNYYKQLRLDMTNGVRNKTCDTCWKMEENNEYSFRSKNNHGIPEEKFDRLIVEAIENNGVMSRTPESIQIKLGNLCNLKCVMCNQASSNLIQDEIIFWKKEKIEIPSWLKWVEDWEIDWTGIDKNLNLDTIWDNLKAGLVNAKQIQLVGGEPLVNPITPVILERLVECDAAKDIRIFFISNLTSLSNKIIGTLSEFKESVICISWDHVDPEKFRFIRFPARYDHFRKNVDKLLASKIQPKISVTVSIFNIFDIEEMFNEFEQVSQSRDSQFTINLQYVEYPNYFSIRYLNPEQKDAIINMINDYLDRTADYKVWRENQSAYEQLRSLKQILSVPPEDFNDVIKERTRVLELYDVTRHTDYKSLYPFLK